MRWPTLWFNGSRPQADDVGLPYWASSVPSGTVFDPEWWVDELERQRAEREKQRRRDRVLAKRSRRHA